MTPPVCVALFGLGPIGRAVGKLVLSRGNLTLVGATDIDARLQGSDLGFCLEIGEELGVTVTADADAMLAAARPEVVLHCTQSSLAQVAPQLETIIGGGAHVVSTCEELAFPWLSADPLVARLDRSARERGLSVLGTGVNPGYAMDAVPLMLSAAAQRVDHVRVERQQDAGRRRLPLMRKVGVGISLEEFERRRATIGHIGLPQSLALLGAGLGWRFERTEISLEPVVAAEAAEFAGIAVARGSVLGVHETVRGFVAGSERVVLDLRMYAGAPDPHDAVEIEGVPALRLRIDGLHGDYRTAAVAVNCIASVLRAPPGLLTMRDLPLVSSDAGELRHGALARHGHPRETAA